MQVCSINSPVLCNHFNFIVFTHFTPMSNSIPRLRKWLILKKKQKPKKPIKDRVWLFWEHAEEQSECNK